MKKLKRLFSLLTTLTIIATICVPTLNVSASELYFREGDFCYDILNGKAIIKEITPQIKELNIPETVTHNGITYPVTDLNVDIEGYSNDDFGGFIETINVSKNIKTIMFTYADEYLSTDHYYFTLKTINIPSGSKLNFLSFNLDCQNLENINIAPDSKLKHLYLENCPKLRKLTLPKTLKYCSFGDVPNLRLTITKDNKYLKVKNNQILSKDGKKLYDVVGWNSDVKVSKTVKVICSDFGNGCITKLTLGKKVSKLERYSLAGYSFASKRKIKIILKNKKKAPKIEDRTFDNAKNIKFYVQNKKVAKDLKKKLKGSGIKKAKILIGKKVIYKNING